MDTLTQVLATFGQAVLDVYEAFKFELFGMQFNWLQIIIWFTIAFFVIDIIKDFTDL